MGTLIPSFFMTSSFCHISLRYSHTEISSLSPLRHIIRKYQTQTYIPSFLALLKMLQQAKCSLSSKTRNQIKLGHNSSFLGENKRWWMQLEYLLSQKLSRSGCQVKCVWIQVTRNLNCRKCPALSCCLLWTATSSLFKAASTHCNNKHFFTSFIQKYPRRTLQTKYKNIKYSPSKQHRTATGKWTHAYVHVYGHTHTQTNTSMHTCSEYKTFRVFQTISHYQRHIHHHQVFHPRNALQGSCERLRSWVPPCPPHQHLWQQGSEKALEEACSPIQNR